MRTLLTPPERTRLETGERIRQLRKLRQVDQTTLAERAGMSQTKVSRIETGHVFPSDDEVERLARALGSPDATIIELRGAAAAAREVAEQSRAWRSASSSTTGLQSWRTLLRRGVRSTQEEFIELEAHASVVRSFQMGVVPGLLQTADYAKAVYTLFDPDMADSAEDIGTSRFVRQRVLYDTTKRFEFVVTESALRARVVPDHVLLGQLDRLTTLVGLEHISLGVLMADVPPKTVPMGSFDIYDEDIVTIETFSSRAIVREHDDIVRYVDAFSALGGSAYYGADMVRAIREIADAIAEHVK
jgi:transcriptional regulator with XRE-family HTH domain